MIGAPTAIQTMPPGVRTPQAGPDARELRDFASVLGTDRRGPLGRKTETPEAQAKDAAERFVATALVAPVLKELRETNNAAEPFAPTQGEKQFRSLLDQQVALNVVRGAQFPLVDRLAQHLLRSSGSAGAEPAATRGANR